MHIPVSLGALKRRTTSVYSYFRTGVAVEGRASLCDSGHPQVFFADMRMPKAPQHVDVELRFWNRRGERVTVMEIVRAEIPTYGIELVSSNGSQAFEQATLEPGAAPEERSFTLVPKNDPTARVEASVGSWLELEFRPSRGSERCARPRFRCQLALSDSD